LIIIATVITRSGCPSCPKTLQAPGHPDTQVSVGEHGPRHDSLGQAYRGDSPVPTQPIINSPKHQLNYAMCQPLGHKKEFSTIPT